MNAKSLFEILVPVCEIAHTWEQVPEGKFVNFENELLTWAGGYTALPDVRGAWLNETRVYRDIMRPYRVACDNESLLKICAAASRLFAGEECFFVAEIGRAWIVPRAISDTQRERLLRAAGTLRDVNL